VQEPLQPAPSWRAGHYVWPAGRTKIVLLGGIGTRTGDAERAFSGMTRFLAERGGYDGRRDFLEGTFAGTELDGGWRPTAYGPADTRRPLIDMAEAVAGCLDFYRQALPAEAQLCVVGYSLGGVVAVDGATLAVARDREAWHNRLAAVVTLAAPLPAPGESLPDLQIPTSVRRPGSLGHGAILDEPSVWRRILGVVGPQAQVGTPSADPIEAELNALKDRLRREGRIV